MNHLSFSTTLSSPNISNEEISVTIDEKNETDQKVILQFQILIV